VQLAAGAAAGEGGSSGGGNEGRGSVAIADAGKRDRWLPVMLKLPRTAPQRDNYLRAHRVLLRLCARSGASLFEL